MARTALAAPSVVVCTVLAAVVEGAVTVVVVSSGTLISPYKKMTLSNGDKVVAFARIVSLSSI